MIGDTRANQYRDAKLSLSLIGLPIGFSLLVSAIFLLAQAARAQDISANSALVQESVAELTRESAQEFPQEIEQHLIQESVQETVQGLEQKSAQNLTQKLNQNPAEKSAQRIVSLNLCIDQMLVKLVHRSRIASLTYLSWHPQLSRVTSQLDGIIVNHGLAEEIVPLQPDLILAGEFGAGEAVSLLQDLGYPVERLALPRTLNEILEHIESLGKLVSAEADANLMTQRLRAQLTHLDGRVKKLNAAPTTAIWYSPNGVVAGRDTLEHELMERAGFRNLAAEMGIVSFAQLDLEQLIAAAPQVLIVETGYVQAFSVAREYLQHPALARKSRLLELPAPLSVCSAPVIADILRALGDGREFSAPL